MEKLEKEEKPINLKKLLKFLKNKLKKEGRKLTEGQLVLLERHIQKTKFYLRLQKFGYILRLKPVKTYLEPDGTSKRKANCDIEMAFEMMKMIGQYAKAVVLSGDGDFTILLKYLMKKSKGIFVLARGERTAREIRQLARGNFRDFHYLKYLIKFEEK